MAGIVIFCVIIFCIIKWSQGIEEEQGIFHLKHIYGIPSCDYFTDINTRINDNAIILNITRNIYFSNIKYFNFYSKKINTSQTNFKNALIGGIIAGGAGAIIGSCANKQVTETYYFMEIVYTKNNQQAIIVLSDNPKNINNKLREFAISVQKKAQQNNIDINITGSSFEQSETYKIMQQ